MSLSLRTNINTSCATICFLMLAAVFFFSIIFITISLGFQLFFLLIVTLGMMFMVYTMININHDAQYKTIEDKTEDSKHKKLTLLNSTYLNYDPKQYEEANYPNRVERIINPNTQCKVGSFDNNVNNMLNSNSKSWVYWQHYDALRDRLIQFASKSSSNKIQIPSSYKVKESILKIELREASDRPPSVAFKITEGHLCSNSRNECLLHVRFDNADILDYEWVKFSGITEVVVFKDADQLIEKIKSASSLIVELPFYINYKTVALSFEFDVKDLAWDHERKVIIAESDSVNHDEASPSSGILHIESF